MKKKALILLVLLPFLIGLLAFATSSYVIRSVEQDVQDITWEYEENSPFYLKNGKQKLNASAIYDKDLPLSEGNDLIWESDNENIASILKDETGVYLVPKGEGKCIITCSNKKRTVIKQFTAVIVGDNGAIIVNPLVPFSQTGIANTKIVGLYDKLSSYDSKTIDSNLKLNIEVLGGSIDYSDIEIKSTSNIIFDRNSKTIKFLEAGDAHIEFINPFSFDTSTSLDFKLVEGFNIYDYDDLLSVTNKTNKSYTSVLRVNLESLENTYDANFKLKSKDTKLFGHLDENKKLKSFKNDIYTYESTYNHEFLNNWNKNVDNGTLENKMKVETKCLAGIHIHGDIYGNGFTINTHNLVYPSETKEIISGNEKHKVASLGANDLFRGPLKFVSLGDPYLNEEGIKPIFTLNGEDNSSFYLDKDNCLIDNLTLRGSTFSSNLSNYQYSGNVLNVLADNVKITNSIIENGRNTVRSYSSMNLEISNCIIRNGMEFLFRSGSNKFNHVDYNKEIEYYKGDTKVLTNVKTYLKPVDFGNYQKDYSADNILTNYTISNTQANEFAGIPLFDYTYNDYMNAKTSVIDALTNESGIINEDGSKNYDGTCVLDKVFFANSGISAISLDSMPQGSFLENSITSLFKLIIGMYMNFLPSNLALTGYPTSVSLVGDCRFYDWKKKDNLTFESLIEQDIASLIIIHGGLGDGFGVNIGEDDYLPIKKLLLDNYSDAILNNDKLNLPIYFEGGGYNASDVYIDEGLKSVFTNELVIDPFEYSLSLKADPVPNFNTSPKAKYQAMKIAMLRASFSVKGFNDYRIVALNNSSNKWYNESLKMEDLLIK